MVKVLQWKPIYTSIYNILYIFCIQLVKLTEAAALTVTLTRD